MPTIKITSGGKVVTNNGKVSCTCCGCSGPWGPGYDTFPTDLYVDGIFATRISKCSWYYYGGASVTFGLDFPGLWQANQDVPPGVGKGYKPGPFSDGPLGNYYANPDGTGALIHTVT